MVLDLSLLRFIDAYGVRMIRAMHSAVDGQKAIDLVPGPKGIMLALEIAGLISRCRVLPSATAKTYLTRDSFSLNP